MNNPLTELIPAVYRRYVYLAAAAALFIYGLWEVSAGDVKSFAIALGSALVSGLAASNTPTPTPVEDAGDDAGYEDDLTYEEAGGLPYEDSEPLFPPGSDADRAAGDPNRY